MDIETIFEDSEKIRQLSGWVIAGLPMITFKKYTHPPRRLFTTMDELYCLVGISRKDAEKRSRGRNSVATRGAMMYLLRHCYGVTYKKIGELLSNPNNKPFDHTTTIHAIKSFASNVSAPYVVDTIYQELYDAIKDHLPETAKILPFVPKKSFI